MQLMKSDDQNKSRNNSSINENQSTQPLIRWKSKDKQSKG